MSITLVMTMIAAFMPPVLAQETSETETETVSSYQEASVDVIPVNAADDDNETEAEKPDSSESDTVYVEDNDDSNISLFKIFENTGSVFLIDADEEDASVELMPTEGTCGDNLTWTLDDDGTLTVSGEGDMTGYTSYSKVPWYSSRTAVISVVIADGVKSIGAYAFYGCTSLENITISESITAIGNYSFYSCTSLADITIPNGVTSIGKDAFYGCTSLVAVNISDSVTSIGTYAFYNCSGLESVELSEGITKIDGYVFCGSTSLASITIPDGATSIGGHAFYNCKSLESINIPDSVTTIESAAFSHCTNLIMFVVPDSYAEEYAIENDISYEYIFTDVITLNLKITDANGCDLSTGYTVKWYKKDSTHIVATGNVFAGYEPEEEYEFEVIPTGEFAYEYYASGRQTLEASESNGIYYTEYALNL